MADSFGKKEREKRKRKRKQEKAERKKQRKEEESNTSDIMYVDEYGNFTDTPPDPTKKEKIKAEDIEIGIPKSQDLEDESPIRNGIVKFFNREKRYGFIEDIDARTDYFVHEEALIDEIKENDRVTFELGPGPKGLVAIQVQLSKG